MPFVENFGGRVALLREQLRLSQLDIARRALPEDATERRIQDYADSVSKIENFVDGHTNPTLDRMRSLAKGFGFEKVGDFITQLERATDPPAQRSRDLLKLQGKKDLSEGVAKADNPELDGAALQNAADRIASEGLVVGAAEVIVEAINRTSTALGAIAAELKQLRTDTTQRLERLAASTEQARKSRRR